MLEEILLQAVQVAIVRHPMLRSFIGRNEEGREEWVQFRNLNEDLLVEFSQDAVHSERLNSNVNLMEAAKEELEKTLNDLRFDSLGPQWR